MWFSVPKYRPPSLNTLLRVHWSKRNRLANEAKQLVGAYFAQSGIPKATTRRRVTLTLCGRKQDGRQDDDNAKKLILDALTACGAIVDDGPDWCETRPVEYAIGPEREVRITLEDVP